MNDFTKEELFDLKYAIEKMREPGKDILGFYKLRDKIQSMIDNYCEHDHKSYYEHVPVYECTKCQMVMLR